LSVTEAMFRVDPRLVHATMMNVWVPTTGARVLIIADRALHDDSKLRAIHEMSAMGLVEVRFRTEQTVVEELAKYDGASPVIVLFSSVEGALDSVKNGLRIDSLNVGHVPEGPGRREIHPAVHLGPPEFETIGDLQSHGVRVFVQPLPNDKERVLPEQREPEPREPTPAQDVNLAEDELRVVNARGLHLRAANVLAQACSKLGCEVNVVGRNGDVNAKSLLGLTTLQATMGTLVKVRIEGRGAGKAMEELRDLFATGFGEGVDWVPDAGEVA